MNEAAGCRMTRGYKKLHTVADDNVGLAPHLVAGAQFCEIIRTLNFHFCYNLLTGFASFEELIAYSNNSYGIPWIESKKEQVFKNGIYGGRVS